MSSLSVLLDNYTKLLHVLKRDGIYVTANKVLAKIFYPFQKIRWRVLYSNIKDIDLNNCKVVVIIPCYNYGKYLDQALESVLNQKISCVIDIIIVNDGSTDECTILKLKEIGARGYKNVKIINQSNKGLSAARNAGARVTNSKYIVFLDADDILREDYIGKTVKILERYNNIDIAYSYARIFGDRNDVWHTENLSLRKIQRYNHLPATAVYKKELWEKVGGYDESMKTGYEDWEFWLRCARLGAKGFAIPELLFEYRRHGRTMHSSAEEKYKKIVEYIKQKNSL